MQSVTRRPEIQRPSNNTTENLKQKKNISWALVDLATDKSSGPNQLKWIALGRGHHRVWCPIHPRAIKECSKAINHDWVNNLACRLRFSHDVPKPPYIWYIITCISRFSRDMPKHPYICCIFMCLRVVSYVTCKDTRSFDALLPTKSKFALDTPKRVYLMPYLAENQVYL